MVNNFNQNNMKFENIVPTDNFCKCNNCEAVMFDMNPQLDAKEYGLNQFSDAVLMVWNQKEFAYVCPNCGTDEYLQDL